MGTQAQALTEDAKVDRGEALSAAVWPRGDRSLPKGQDPQGG